MNQDLHEQTDTYSDNIEFAKHADQPQAGVVAEFIDFLKHNKKWWLTPIVIALFLIGTLLVLGSSGAAPFIYTLF